MSREEAANYCYGKDMWLAEPGMDAARKQMLVDFLPDNGQFWLDGTYSCSAIDKTGVEIEEVCESQEKHRAVFSQNNIFSIENRLFLVIISQSKLSESCEHFAKPASVPKRLQRLQQLQLLQRLCRLKTVWS
jgi:hypothetical protein